MFCIKCGEKIISSNAAFCGKCGTKLIQGNGENQGGMSISIEQSEERPISSTEITSESDHKFVTEDRFNVVLTSIGLDKAGAAKVVREWTGAGLTESEMLVDQLPALLKKNIIIEEAIAIKKALAQVNAMAAITDREAHIAKIVACCKYCGNSNVTSKDIIFTDNAISQREGCEEDRFNVMLVKSGFDKISTVKKVSEWMETGLAETEAIIAQVPVVLKKDVTLKEASAIWTALTEVGATVVFTNQEGHIADVPVRCKTCGTVIQFDVSMTDNIIALKENREDSNNSTKGKWGELFDKFQNLSVLWKWVIGAVGIGCILFCIWLLIILIGVFFSSPIYMIAAVVGGYILYHKGIAECITEYLYKRSSKELQLPKGMSAVMLLEALSGKFNYPYFKGVHYGTMGECVIEGKYSMYPIVVGRDNRAELSYVSKENNKKKRTVLLEAMAIRDYINKFFNPGLRVDTVKDMKKLKFAESQRKTVAIVSTAVSVLIIAAVAWDFFSPGSLQSMVVPGIEVRGAYLSQYSSTVTIEEAFENYFEDGKWSKYDSEGYTYVVFTGSCWYFDERDDVRIVFKITGENFIVDSLDINGVAQNNLIVRSLLSEVYEGY